MADRLDFEIDVELETGLITGHAGVPGLIEAFRQTRTAAVIDREIKLKSRKRGLSVSEMVESLLAMWAAGGERAEDLDQFRQDKAVALLLGHDLPAAQTARDFLAQFHAEDLPLLQEGKAPVAAETVPLLGLAKANAELVLDLQCRRPVKTATLDVDATVIHCDKRAAKRSYDGNRGYQPVLALWAEQDVIVADEFRDGNVPAGSGNRRVVEKALAALPGGFDKIYLRGDSALYEHDLMRWLDEQAIGYAISADMSPQLAECIAALPEGHWKPDKPEIDAIREWAEVKAKSRVSGATRGHPDWRSSPATASVPRNAVALTGAAASTAVGRLRRSPLTPTPYTGEFQPLQRRCVSGRHSDHTSGLRTAGIRLLSSAQSSPVRRAPRGLKPNPGPLEIFAALLSSKFRFARDSLLEGEGFSRSPANESPFIA